MPNYLDIFAGAGGLSEGFIREGYTPLAHIEMDEAACNTLKTRLAYKWLTDHDQKEIYQDYLEQRISRAELYNHIPTDRLQTVLNYEISHESINEIFDKVDVFLGNRTLDLIVGGPPCQAYSLVGRARDDNSMLGDPRNYLYELYAEFLRRYQPHYFVFENVLGLLSAKDKDGQLYFEKMRELFKECDYSTEYKILNAKDYGVLQNRKRIILIGKRGHHTDYFPNIPTVDHHARVSEIFRDLPFIAAGEGTYRSTPTLPYNGSYLFDAMIKNKDSNAVTFHCARANTKQDLKIYRIAVNMWDKENKRITYTDLPLELQTHNNTKSFLDRFKVVAQNLQYSQTVVAHISKDGHYFIHPDIMQNRSLSPREVARLQTFPDDYFFESVSGRPSRTTAFKQIGNAVPVLLAQKIAKALLESW